MNVLVIGGAGYIGSHVVKKYCDEGHTVTVFDNLSTGLVENVDARATLITGDILERSELDAVFTIIRPECVIHLAALKDAGESMHKPEKYSVNNISGSINILNACVAHHTKYFIFSSSAAVYGNPAYLPMDESHPLNPENYYGFTKLEIERILEWYSKLHHIQYAALRYFNAAGYGEKGKHYPEKNPGNLIPIIMEVAIGKRKELQIYGNDYNTLDGTGVRDYIHVLDLADAHHLALIYLETHVQEKKNLIINLSTQKGTSVLEIIQKTEEITRKNIPYKISARRLGDPATVVASATHAHTLLKWKAKHSSIQEIIESTWNVYNENN